MRHVSALALVALLGACSSKPAATAAPPVEWSPDTSPAAASPSPDAIAKLVGRTPPAWQAERWINSAPLALADLRGSVVLVRWWTAGCPFCSATAPSLRAYHRTYADRGLHIIGMYHHKESAPFEPRVYEQTAQQYGFTFPIAVDPSWRTLESWLRDAQGQPVATGFTSVTFLLDRQGVIRHVHPGGQYVQGDPAHAAMTAAIERLLAER